MRQPAISTFVIPEATSPTLKSNVRTTPNQEDLATTPTNPSGESALKTWWWSIAAAARLPGFS